MIKIKCVIEAKYKIAGVTKQKFKLSEQEIEHYIEQDDCHEIEQYIEQDDCHEIYRTLYRTR